MSQSRSIISGKSGLGLFKLSKGVVMVAAVSKFRLKKAARACQIRPGKPKVIAKPSVLKASSITKNQSRPALSRSGKAKLSRPVGPTGEGGTFSAGSLIAFYLFGSLPISRSNLSGWTLRPPYHLICTPIITNPLQSVKKRLSNSV